MFFSKRDVSGQIITTSAEVTLNGGLIRELPQNPLNSGLGIILICPDVSDTSLAMQVCDAYWCYRWCLPGRLLDLEGAGPRYKGTLFGDRRQLAPLTQTLSRWWFQIFFIFTPTWGRFPFWLIFFKWAETTNWLFFLFVPVLERKIFSRINACHDVF